MTNEHLVLAHRICFCFCSRDVYVQGLTAVPENLVLNHFFFLETSTGVSVSRVKSVIGWDPSGFPEKMGYHEITGVGVAGGV